MNVLFSPNFILKIRFFFMPNYIFNTTLHTELHTQQHTSGMQETEVDAKRDLDNVLKTACSNMKQSAIKMLLGPLDGFLAKVTALVGEIPVADPSDRRGGPFPFSSLPFPFICNCCV